MSEHESDQVMLSRLVGCWQGTVAHRSAADQPFEETQGTSDNRWVLGGRFVEMTLRAGDSWSAVFYIGHEGGERRHVLVSLEPGEPRVTTRTGKWSADREGLVLTSHLTRAVCRAGAPGELALELIEQGTPHGEFVRFRAAYRTAAAVVIAKPSPPRPHRRFVIA
jgi:hypothetical protein